MAKINKSIAQFGMPAGMNRAEAGPLDLSSVYYDKASMEAYAQSGKVAYVGQILSLVLQDEEKGTCEVEVYSIQDLNGTLKKVGTSTVGDESTITVDEATGTVSLYGVPGLSWKTEDEKGEEVDVTTYQPLLTKDANGVKLSWIIPSSTTVEGLATEIAGLKTTVGDHTTAISALNTKVDTGEKTVAEYVAEEIAKAEVAAMEFKGAISELPTGLNEKNEGHFYKVTNDIEVNAATLTGPVHGGTYLLQGKAPISGKIYTEVLKATEGATFSGATVTLMFDPLLVDPENISGYSAHEESFTIAVNADSNILSVDYNWADVEAGGIEPCPNKIKIEYTAYSDELLGFVCLTNVEPIDLAVIKKGDSVVWNGHVWYVIPAGDDLDNTWRTITKSYIDENGQPKTVSIENASLDIKPGLVTFDITPDKATFDLTGFKVTDVDSSAAEGTNTEGQFDDNYITGITVDENGVVHVTKRAVTIPEVEYPDITVEGTKPTSTEDNIIVALTDLAVDEEDGHRLNATYDLVAKKAYVDAKVEGTAISITNNASNPENPADTNGVLVVSNIETTEGTHHDITVSTIEVATKAYVKSVQDNLNDHIAVIATATELGHVKSSTANNQVSVEATTGLMTVNNITTDKLVNGTETLVLYGGSATV